MTKPFSGDFGMNVGFEYNGGVITMQVLETHMKDSLNMFSEGGNSQDWKYKIQLIMSGVK